MRHKPRTSRYPPRSAIGPGAMAESREHRRLVAAVVRDMLDVGITGLAAAAPGWPAPPLIGGRRPDVRGYYAIGAAVIAGEAKRGPEAWSSIRQLQDIADALPSDGPAGAGSLLILAVREAWADARDVCGA